MSRLYLVSDLESQKVLYSLYLVHLIILEESALLPVSLGNIHAFHFPSRAELSGVVIISCMYHVRTALPCYVVVVIFVVLSPVFLLRL